MYFRNHIRRDNTVIVSIDKNELTQKQLDYLYSTNNVRFNPIVERENILIITFPDWNSFSQIWSNLLSQ